MEGKKYLAVLAQAVSFYYVGFPQIGRLVAAPWINSLKNEARSENLPGFVGSRFYLGIVLEHLHALLNSHFSYSLVDGFCCVLKETQASQ